MVKPSNFYQLGLLFPVCLAALLGCNDEGNNSSPMGEATITIDGIARDSVTLTTELERLPDSAARTPGPQRYQSNLKITGSTAAPDSFRFVLYVLDQAPQIRERAYLVRKLTPDNPADQAAAALLRTPARNTYRTQLTRQGGGTVIISQIEEDQITGELKALELSSGFETITLSGEFRAVKP